MTAFSDKSQGMQDFLNQLFDVTSAQASSTCSMCKGPAVDFSTELTLREYGISGLCEPCQVIAFSAPPDPDGAVYGIPAPHVDYPHNPGTLYDCAGCEMGPCVCGGETGCVSEHCTYESPDHAIAPAYYDGSITNGGFGE